uniref:Uncharacterized protein n=1 Tax=Panagrolaimus davidi TaxID=227884 RepID=A0A914P9C8_9BILA
MDAATRLNLIDFLFTENGVIASTLENNACKHFQCPREKLDGILDEECVDSFIDLWENVYLHILPNFFGMVYSLEKYNPNIQLRKKFLIHFRDKVLVRVFSEVNYFGRNVPILYPILFAIDIQTMSNTKGYWKFKTLMNRLMGTEIINPRRLTVLSDDQDFLTPLPILPSRVSANLRFNRQTSEIAISTVSVSTSHARQTSLNETNKERSGTLPSPKRSVHFVDEIEDDFDDETTVHV